MPDNLIEFSPSAYQYPLLIKHLLHYPMVHAPDQEIVYRDLRRHSYRVFRERIGRLASGLAEIGVKPGDVVAVLDWDSHRYLECYFAVPMMGAVLQTVNLSLPPEQLLFAMNDAAPSIVLVNADFLPLMEKLADKLPSVRKYVLLHDRKEQPTTRLPIECEYEEMLEANSPFFQFPDFDENTRATTFHTTGTTGRPKGVYFSHRQLVLHTLGITAEYGCAPSQGRIHRDDVYMPLTPMFHVHAWGSPYLYTMMGNKQVYPGRYAPDVLLGLIAREGVTSTHCVPTILQMLLSAPGSKDVDLSKLKMVVGGSAMPRALVRAAMARGIDVFTGYGQSESCPMLTGVHLTTEQLSEDPGGASGAARRRRTAGAAGRSAHRRRGHGGRAARRQDPRRDRRARPMAHHGLSQRSCGVGAALGRRLSAHRGRRDLGRRRNDPHRRPDQGHHQERRRMGLLHSGRGHHLGEERRRESGGHRRQGRQMGRASDGARHRGAGLRRRLRRSRGRGHSRPCESLCRQGRHLEVRDPRPGR